MGRQCVDSQWQSSGLRALVPHLRKTPFAMERLHAKGDQLIYHCPKPQSGGKQGDLILTPLELIDKIAALVPSPRTHRHRYSGLLAPNSPLRKAVAALVIDIPVVAVPVFTVPDEADQASAKRSPARYLWAMLITRIYEVFPLSCLHCGEKSGSLR